MQTSPDNSINSMRDLENKIDQYRGQIGLQELSISQNIKTLSSQEYTIGQNDLKNKELEKFISDNEVIKDTLVHDIAKLEEEKVILNLDIEASRKMLASVNEDTKVITSNLEASKASFVQKESDLKQREELLNGRESNIKVLELEVSKKVNDIRAFKEIL